MERETGGHRPRIVDLTAIANRFDPVGSNVIDLPGSATTAERQPDGELRKTTSRFRETDSRQTAIETEAIDGARTNLLVDLAKD